MGVQGSLSQSLIPDSLDNSLSYSVLNYLKRLKNQAKIEFDRLCNEVGSKPPTLVSGSSGKSAGGLSAVTEGVRVSPRSPLKKDLVSHPLLQGTYRNLCAVD
jgi:integrator complex subunit 6